MKQILISLFLGLLSCSLVQSRVLDYRSVDELSRGQREELVEELDDLLSLPQLVTDDIRALLLRYDGDMSLEKQQHILELAQQADNIQQDIDTLRSIEGFSRQHEAVQMLEGDRSRVEQQIRAELYTDPLKFQSIVALGAAVLFAAAVYKNNAGTTVDAVTDVIDITKSRLLPNSIRAGDDARLGKSLISGAIMFVIVEFILRGRNANALPALVEGTKKAALWLGSIGGEIFKDGGFADRLEVWVEDTWRSLNVDKWLATHKTAAVDFALAASFVAAFVYVIRSRTAAG